MVDFLKKLFNKLGSRFIENNYGQIADKSLEEESSKIFGGKWEEGLQACSAEDNRAYEMAIRHRKEALGEWYANPDYEMPQPMDSFDFISLDEIEGCTIENDDQMHNYIAEINRLQKLGTPEAKTRADKFMGVVKDAVKDGYDINPVLTCIEHRNNVLAEEAKKEGKTLGDDSRIISTSGIESATKSISPYNKVFSVAQELGELQADRARMMRGGSQADLDKMDEQIAALKDKFKQVASGFEPNQLKEALGNKRVLLSEQNMVNGKSEVTQSVDADMYNGLHSAMIVCNQMIKEQEHSMGED